MTAPDFWQKPEAVRTTQQLSELQEEVMSWAELQKQVEELKQLAEEDAADASVSLRPEIEAKLKELEDEFTKKEFALMFSGAHDSANAILAIHAGAGGTDAQDWAEILLRMYLRFCEKQGWRVRVLDESRGGEAGIKSATLEVRGQYAYGYLKSENGVHRLVRISPFDAEKMRHTSFALVEVVPEIAEAESVEIDPKDIRVDTYLSSGHGGQSVQTTYSAVRIVHEPTKITVTCQNERSQQQNRETAMKILQAKLFHLQEQEREKERLKLRGEYHEAAWGNQIRSYVLHPYRMVKDHRTEFETGDTEAVLDGELKGFIEAYLRSLKQGV